MDDLLQATYCDEKVLEAAVDGDDDGNGDDDVIVVVVVEGLLDD